MLSPHTRHTRTRVGSTLPVVAILLVVLVGMVAFAIDIGRVAHARTGLQSAADAGALAGIGRVQSGTKAKQDFTAGKAEVNTFVGGSAGNFPGLTVKDADIQFGYFDPNAAVGTRFTTTPTSQPANALRVALRRDGAVNPRLPLAFSPLLGRSEGTVVANATAWAPPVTGLLPAAPVIPYVAQVDYFNAAAGLPPRPTTAPGFVSVSASLFNDNWSIGTVGTVPTPGGDGVKEIVLFGDTNTVPGNFGSVDLGGTSNGTGDLNRQLVSGPNASDFTIMKSAGQLAPDGSLQAPVTLTGDGGVSNGTRATWSSIIGQNRIIPLYSTVSGSGDGARYQIVGFAGVRIVDVKMSGSPKKVYVQSTAFYSTRVTAASKGSPISIGVYAAPRLVIP